MRIHSKLSYQWIDRLGKFALIEDIAFDYDGLVDFCKGAGSQLTGIGQSQQSFMNTLQQDFGTAFSGQQSILNNLSSTLSSTLANGPGQYGFSAPETAALNTQATSGTAAQTRNAQQAAGEASAAQNGGNAVLPNNAAAQTQAGIAQAGAQQTSNQLLGIKEAGYQQGNQNYNTALSGLTNVAGLENPTGVAGAANTAGSGAAGTATTVQNLNNAASPWNVAGGILGGLASTALNFALPGAGSILGGASGVLGNIGGGGSTGGVDFGPPPITGSSNGFLPTGAFGG